MYRELYGELLWLHAIYRPVQVSSHQLLINRHQLMLSYCDVISSSCQIHVNNVWREVEVGAVVRSIDLGDVVVQVGFVVVEQRERDAEPFGDARNKTAIWGVDARNVQRHVDA